MAVTYDEYEAEVLQRVVAMLADASAFQTWVGAANATAAKAFIIESFGGDPRDVSGDERMVTVDDVQRDFNGGPLAVVHSESLEATPVAHLTYDYSGVVVVLLFIPWLAADTPPEIFRRGRNVAGAIRQGLQDLVQTSTAYLAEAAISSTGPTLDDITGAKADFLQAELRIEWRG